MPVKFQDEAHVEIQMTSLIDCVFILLIFFLVSSQMKKVEKELPIELPRAALTVPAKASPNLTAISIDKYGDLYVNGQPVGAEGLRAALRNAAATHPDMRVRINGDIFAPFRAVVQVLDTCQGEGLNVIGINTAVDLNPQK
ncbi:MAG: biopolymer transporter ExbD [Kiritimatiellaeota bacterium]|nr:biopolymer transporter ExbD [Kiritimatiellota bacterium]